ncbi:MAG: SusC/RagA family TonB-linked outer membrane protein [Ferruginibacter sp.]
MKRMLQLMLYFSILLFYAPLVFAQSKNVSGVVTGEGGRPLPGVTVTVKGTTNITSTDANGVYSVNVSAGQTLVFSYVNYAAREAKVGSGSSINVSLSLSQTQLEEVVVTAMDQKRNPRELGASTQTARGDDLKQSQRENILNSLQGRIAGLTINPTSGAAGAGSQIVLRGFNSLSLDNSPLFVIDGIIADNSTVNETSGGGSQLGLASDRPNRANDYSNRMADINPDDIESITVLKGPEATALYGSQASSGAIIITTKKARTSKGLRINYDNSFRISKQTRLPENYNKYMGGTNGLPQDIFAAFGPAYDANTKLYDNRNNFFRTGHSQTHNMAVEFGTPNVGFRLSGSVFNQSSVIPNNDLTRYTARFSNTTKIGKKIEINPSVTYTNTKNNKVLRGASGYLLNLLVWPVDDDIRNYQTSDGLKKPLYNQNPNGELDNPLYNVNKIPSQDKTNRLVATLGINVTPFDWLTLSGRFGYDTYHTDGYTRFDSMSFYTTRAQKGYQDNYYRDYYGYNHTLTATAKRKFGKFTTRLMVGNMWQDYETQQYAVSGSNLKSMNRTDSSNTDSTTRVRLSNAKKGLPNYSISRQMAYFGEVMIGWKDMIYLTYSHRFETSSIFPKDFRNYNYPAANMSIILSDLVPGLKSRVLSFWKLRGSLANTARTSAPYANQSLFNDNTGSGGGFYYGFSNNNPLLEPERQETFEVGTEARFLNSRFTIDATYYNTKNKKLIVEGFRSSYGTGFVLNTLNVGSTQNQGVEVAISADLIKNKKFSWNSRFNFNKMWNEVLTLPDNVPEFYIGDTWLAFNTRGGMVRGGATTTLTSYGYQRNNKGQILVSPTTGLPLVESLFKPRGDRNPDFTLGWQNNFTYKNFKISMLWDLKMGGDIYNATDMYLTTNGRSLRTQLRELPIVVNGVLADGLENTDNPTKNTIAVVPYLNDNYYKLMPEEEFIEKDVNWFRLRDITVSYSFSKNLIDRLKYVRNLSAFVTLNDPILITNYSGADPQVNGNTSGGRGVGAFGMDYGNLGMPVSFNFGIRAGF